MVFIETPGPARQDTRRILRAVTWKKRQSPSQRHTIMAVRFSSTSPDEDNITLNLIYYRFKSVAAGGGGGMCARPPSFQC